MTVKQLKERLKDFDDESKIQVVLELKKNSTQYSITYTPIQCVREVLIGVGVHIVGIVIP